MEILTVISIIGKIYKKRSEIKSIYNQIYKKLYGSYSCVIFTDDTIIENKTDGIITTIKGYLTK